MKHSKRTTFALALPLALVAGCTTGSKQAAAPAAAAAPQYKVQAAKATMANYGAPKGFKRYRAPGAFNVNPLLYPKRDHVGAFVGDAATVAQKNAFAKKTGAQPTIIKQFYSWGQPLNKAWAQSIWKAGAIPQIELESWPDRGGLTLKQIAAGRGDAYVKQLAKDIRAINIPVGFSFGHEFNGYWYPWGLCVKASDLSCKVKPKQFPSDFKKAWKRMHGQFKTAGATNAIWIWQANEIGPRPANKLKYWYPGSSYVDWLGIVGYYYASNNRNHTFKTLFIPTINQMKTFAANKPILIPEVSTEPSKRSAADVRDFLKGVGARRDVIGFMWFDINKPSENKDWRVNARKDELNAFKYWIKRLNFGVKVK